MFLTAEPCAQKYFIGSLFLKKIDKCKNKGSRNEQKFDVDLTNLITHDELTRFDGSY
jgi:hypothetical protein